MPLGREVVREITYPSSRWRAASPWVRAELVAGAWEIFSVLLFVSAVFPAAFASPWPAVLFLTTLAASALLARRLARTAPQQLRFAAAVRVPAWLVAVTPLLPGSDLRVLIACCGFGVMAFGIRRAVYRRWFEPQNVEDIARLSRELRDRLAENAAVAGIVGGHVMMLFSVAFLRTQSIVVFRAWWEVVPVLALLGTVGFMLAARRLSASVLTALADGTTLADGTALADGTTLADGTALADADRLPVRLSAVNFALWLTCIAIGVAVIHAPTRRAPDVIVELSFGALFAWGVSFYQRGWHDDTMRPVLTHFARRREPRPVPQATSLRRRMLSEFGVPLLFTMALSLFASIGLYRALSSEPTWRDDFNAIVALSVSFAMLVLAVGNLFQRAARNLSAPLAEIATIADRVATGELALSVPSVTGPREVAGLGRSIERMRQALADTIGELETERGMLEVRVADRTRELRRALDELKQTQTALVHGERMAVLGQLVAGVAHELNNPLSAVSGSISALARIGDELGTMLSAARSSEAHLPPVERERLEALRVALDVDGALADLSGVARVVESATRRSVELVTNLKTFARTPAEPRAVDLAVGFDETFALLAHRFRELDIVVEKRIEPLGLVHCRAGELHQVFMNLLTNAVDAIGERPQLAVVRTVIVSARSDGDDVVVSVADDGPGVPPSLEETIFEPFFTTKPAGKGTGLGLSISRELLHRQGGTIHVERAPAPLAGACFVCRFPRISANKDVPPESGLRGSPPQPG